MPGSQEGLSLKGPLRSQVPMWLYQAWAELPAVLLWGPRPSLPTIRLSSLKCPAVGGQSHVALPHPVLCYLRAWPWHLKTLPCPRLHSRADLCCGKAWQPLRVRPTRRTRPHPLCLDSLGDRCPRPSLLSLSVWGEQSSSSSPFLCWHCLLCAVNLC